MQKLDPKSDAEAGKLADGLRKALEGMTPEERAKLAEKIKKQAEGGGTTPGGPESRRRMKELADQLSTPEGQKALEESLRRMANDDTESDESRRQGALGEADRGGAEAEGQVGGKPIPTPIAGPGGAKPGPGQGASGNQPGNGDAKGGTPGGGHHEDTGHGDHSGHTDPVGADGITARAHGRIDKGAPLPGVTMGRTAGRAGDTANVRGSGALGAVGPDEVGGVERSEVPEEYREQIGRYFQP